MDKPKFRSSAKKRLWGPRLFGILFFMLLLGMFSGAQALAAVWYVTPTGAGSQTGASWENAFSSIQAAIDVAFGEDEIWVKGGTYLINETITVNREVAIIGGFYGSETVSTERDLKNETLINGQGIVFTCFSVTASAILDGLTIIGGRNPNFIEVINAVGGGIAILGASPEIRNCTVAANEAYYGAGIGSFMASPTIFNCVFYDNTAGYGGGGIYNYRGSNINVANCTFYNNYAGFAGGGLFDDEGVNSIRITNGIFWGNTAGSGFPQIAERGVSNAIVSYCDVQGGYDGEGNKADDPLFFDPATRDLHLLPASPCISTGLNLSDPWFPSNDRDGNPRVVGAAIDMGAYEFQPTTGDSIPPVITLLGDDSLVLEIGTAYVEPGATATDNVDGDITARIVIDSSEVNVNEVGIYEVTYNVSDSSGNAAVQVVRTVEVVDRIRPTFELSIPSDGAPNVALDTNIVVLVRDSGSGVNQGTIQMTVEGVDVTSLLVISGSPSDYTVTHNPASDFANGQEVNVTVTAADLAENLAGDSFSFLTVSGSVWSPGGDDDEDGIANGIEETLLGTDPSKKTLFVRPKIRTGFSTYAYWDGFILLFPSVGRPGFADIAPFTNAGIEISVIGDSTNPYQPMRAFDYDPQTDANHPPCDILEVVYMQATDYCNFDLGHNKGHTLFTGTTWSWDTKGYTPHSSESAHYLKYEYFTALVYPYPLENYFNEGAYANIAVGDSPIRISNCGYRQCWEVNQSSPMNLNAGNPVSGLPDETVEFNQISFSGTGEITSIGAVGNEYFIDEVLKRTIVHEMGHALLEASDELDHCGDFECIMYHSSKDWELHNFGSPSGCIHSPGGSRDIRATGIVHNKVHP